MDMTRLYKAIPYRIRPYRPIDPTEPGPVIDRKEATVDSIDAVDSVDPANVYSVEEAAPRAVYEAVDSVE